MISYNILYYNWFFFFLNYYYIYMSFDLLEPCFKFLLSKITTSAECISYDGAPSTVMRYKPDSVNTLNWVRETNFEDYIDPYTITYPQNSITTQDIFQSFYTHSNFEGLQHAYNLDFQFPNPAEFKTDMHLNPVPQSHRTDIYRLSPGWMQCGPHAYYFLLNTGCLKSLTPWLEIFKFDMDSLPLVYKPLFGVNTFMYYEVYRMIDTPFALVNHFPQIVEWHEDPMEVIYKYIGEMSLQSVLEVETHGIDCIPEHE